MQSNYIPSITDDVLAEIEAECRANKLRPDGQVDGHGAASNAETLSMIRRLRESEARLWSLCTAHTLRDTERLAREVSGALEYTMKNLKTGEVK